MRHRLKLVGVLVSAGMALIFLADAWAGASTGRRAGLMAGGGVVQQHGLVVRSAIGQPSAGGRMAGELYGCAGLICGAGAAADAAPKRRVWLPVVHH
jgi:hypothetical protein